MARQWRVSPSFRGANLALGSYLGQTTAFGTLLFFPPAKRPVTGPLRALLILLYERFNNVYHRFMKASNMYISFL